MSVRDKRDEKLGAAWNKYTRDGDQFMTGDLEIDGQKIAFAMFKNTYKKPESREPDWRIVRGRDRTQMPPKGGAARMETAPAQAEEYVSDNDDVPF